MFILNIFEMKAPFERCNFFQLIQNRKCLSSDIDNKLPFPPPEILEKAKNVCESLVPQKSRKTTKNCIILHGLKKINFELIFLFNM